MHGRNGQNKQSALVKAYVLEQLTPRTRRLAQLAWWDLYYGPLTSCDVCGVDHLDECRCEHRWPGFESATKEISKELDDLGDLWVDIDCDHVTDREPQGEEIDGEWCEPFWEEIYHYTRRDALRAVFGELADYL